MRHPLHVTHQEMGKFRDAYDQNWQPVASSIMELVLLTAVTPRANAGMTRQSYEFGLGNRCLSEANSSQYLPILVVHLVVPGQLSLDRRHQANRSHVTKKGLLHLVGPGQSQGLLGTSRINHSQGLRGHQAPARAERKPSRGLDNVTNRPPLHPGAPDCHTRLCIRANPA
jgi:hypothetical protein